MEISIDYTALRIYPRPTRGYELSIGASLAKVGRDDSKDFYVRKKSDQIDLFF